MQIMEKRSSGQDNGVGNGKNKDLGKPDVDDVDSVVCWICSCAAMSPIVETSPSLRLNLKMLLIDEDDCADNSFIKCVIDMINVDGPSCKTMLRISAALRYIAIQRSQPIYHRIAEDAILELNMLYKKRER